MTPKQLDSIAMKLDVGIIGLLWCKGSKTDKANFLFDLVKNPPKITKCGVITNPNKHPNEFWADDTPKESDIENQNEEE